LCFAVLDIDEYDGKRIVYKLRNPWAYVFMGFDKLAKFH